MYLEKRSNYLFDFKCTHGILMNPDVDLKMSEIDFFTIFFTIQIFIKEFSVLQIDKL